MKKFIISNDSQKYHDFIKLCELDENEVFYCKNEQIAINDLLININEGIPIIVINIDKIKFTKTLLNKYLKILE